ncbi:hypothetical protein LRS05_07075 [Flavobacterium sp. J372]|uniref:hypothetical protein n=1 Tax=Flavobacterium sp. J372 TaxID=2898436 RepID=UPI002150C4CC|nr:hypothetical protein [Flavobacterium sp. J372]MCR5861911.1 hypothetical protein [Flavobacterium sp. J372]
MQTKLILFLSIIILFVLMLYIRDSRKHLWKNNRQGRYLTIRSMLFIGMVIIILFFSLIR